MKTSTLHAKWRLKGLAAALVGKKKAFILKGELSKAGAVANAAVFRFFAIVSTAAEKLRLKFGITLSLLKDRREELDALLDRIYDTTIAVNVVLQPLAASGQDEAEPAIMTINGESAPELPLGEGSAGTKR